MIRRTSPRPPAAILAACALALAAIPGCKHGAFFLGGILGIEKVPAMYEPRDQPTLVLVDDPNHLLPAMPLMGVIAATVEHDLKKQKVITTFIEPNKVDELRVNNRDFNQWPVDRVGQMLGAKQVIYILVGNFAVNGGDENIIRPTAAVRVKVIDVANGKRLFPETDKLGQPVLSKMFYKDVNGATRSTESVMARELAQRLGEDIAVLFYKHEPRNELAPTREYQ